ncbi:hypothetical protein [Paenibacillus kobensis]|uniref:hypothetical protein n=1 Tax=Paenibacillus kobensis TaxID=59841 RepID=UPI000FD9AE7C|nr:hypothetical protein [Paenibacillus kobensis]
MKHKIVLNILMVGIVLLVSSCGANDNRSNTSPDERLPVGYTIANIESAIDECINYIMWNNPEEEIPRPAGSEPYVGQQVSVEVRLYTDPSGGHKVYAQSNVDIWKDLLFKFDRLGGEVYCTGHANPVEESGPEGDYEVIDTISLQVQPVRDPHFGTSPEKDRMIKTVENKVTAMCEDFTAGSDGKLYLDSDVYMVDFYEYEMSVGFWFVLKGGNAYYSGVGLRLDKTTNEYEITGKKGFPLNNIDSMKKGDPGRFMFDRMVQAAIKHYKCGESGLKSV